MINNELVLNETRCILIHLIKSLLNVTDKYNITNCEPVSSDTLNYLDEIAKVLEDYQNTVKSYSNLITTVVLDNINKKGKAKC